MTKQWIFGWCAVAVLGIGCTASDTKKMGGTGGLFGGGGSGGSGSGTGGSTTGSGGSGGLFGSGGSGGLFGSGGSGGAVGTGGSGGTTDDGGMDTAVGTGGTGGVAPMDAAPEVVVDPAAACMSTSWMVMASALCDNAVCIQYITSPTAKEPIYAIDGDPTTRYTSGRAQGSMGPETFDVIFPKVITIAGIGLTTMAGDGPAMYRVESSMDGTTWTPFTPAVEGVGSDALVIPFPAKAMKAVRVTQTGTKVMPWWSIHEFTVTGCVP